MYGLRILLLSGLALSFAINPIAQAADDSSLKVDESKPRQSRGIGFPNIIAPVSVQAPTRSAVSTAAPQNAGKVAKVPPRQLPRPSVLKKHSIIADRSKSPQPKVNVASEPKTKPSQSESSQSKPVTANEGATALCSYKHEDGAVISATLDRKGEMPRYKVGENMVVNIKAFQDCNIVVFNYDSTGNLTQIFPNDYQTNGFLRANDSVEIGGHESKFDYQIAGKGGPEKIFVYAYPSNSKNPITIAMQPIAGSPFRGGELTVDEYRNLVNNSKVFFARSVQVVPKKGTQLVSSQPATAGNNKIELTFMVDK